MPHESGNLRTEVFQKMAALWTKVAMEIAKDKNSKWRHFTSAFVGRNRQQIMANLFLLIWASKDIDIQVFTPGVLTFSHS
jgi:Ran GTPase-activating protein (RanGAP) involved in mRNA processing and transport